MTNSPKKKKLSKEEIELLKFQKRFGGTSTIRHSARIKLLKIAGRLKEK